MARFAPSGRSAAPRGLAARRGGARRVGAHRLNRCARAPVGRRQSLEMPGQVLLDLALRLGEEGEVPAVAERAGDRADRERAGVPERVEKTGRAAELADALGAPGEVILLL